MNFDRIAPIYHAIERFTTGSRMQRSRLAHLAAVSEAKRVLIAGEGNGRFLAACAKSLPETHFTIVDESSIMLRLTEKRWKQAGGKLERVRFIQADLLTWTPPGPPYDLIVTHFFLDCFGPLELETLLRKLDALAAPGARWLLADFCTPPHGLANLRARLTLSFAYALFRAAANVQAKGLTPPDAILQKLNYTLTNRVVSDWGMIHSDLWTQTRL